jgi:two-component system response regulator YesN
VKTQANVTWIGDKIASCSGDEDSDEPPGTKPPLLGNGYIQFELLRLDHASIEKYLKYGVQAELDNFIEAYLAPITDSSLCTAPILSYILIDLVVTAARFIHDLGGDLERVVPEYWQLDSLLPDLNNPVLLRKHARSILLRAMDYRDQRASSHYGSAIRMAREYIDGHYGNPDLSLNSVASLAKLYPSHFSILFSREVGASFIEYLTRLRINRAMELLRTTALKSVEISIQVGYNDPRYFSAVFKKVTGFSPRGFRDQVQVH